MSYRSDLIAAALVGTGRASAPVPTGLPAPLGDLLEQLRDQAPERCLLASAALVTLWERGGAEPAPAPQNGPALAPVDDRLTPCPHQAARLVGRMIRDRFGPVLPEALSIFAARGYALPHRWLPELLDLAHQKADLRPLITPVLGARGRWLAGQNPDWRELLIDFKPETAAETWETGPRQVRLALLQQLRETDPARAWELIESTWDEEAAADRAAFLTVLPTGLNPADEPFLEIALNDRSKQVRAAAADLLARLPTSSLTTRMESRLNRLLALERGFLGRARLRLILPETYEPTMARDGIDEKPPAGLGQRAGWLLQMLAVVPPAHWSRQWDRSPDEIIRLAGGTEYETVLLEGWTRAAARHGDDAWAEALLRRWIDAPWSLTDSNQPADYPSDSLIALLQYVPAQRLEQWLTGLVRKLRSPDEHRTLLALLQEHRRPWGEALTRAILDFLRQSSKQVRQQGAWRWRVALPDLALYAAPALAGEAERGWPEVHPWQQSLDQFLSTLRFRDELLKALP